MFLINKAYATVWSVEDKGKFFKGRISTSEKDNRNEGQYINSNWFATFVGKAKEKAQTLGEKDRIIITSGKITNALSGEGENRKSYLNVTIFDFEMNNGNTFNSSDSDDLDLPF